MLACALPPRPLSRRAARCSPPQRDAGRSADPPSSLRARRADRRVARWSCRRTPTVSGCSGRQPPLPLLLVSLASPRVVIVRLITPELGAPHHLRSTCRGRRTSPATVALHRQRSRATARARRRRGRTLRPRACCRWRESSYPQEGCRASSSPRSLSLPSADRGDGGRARARETRDATQRHAYRALFAIRSLARTQPPSQARAPRVACARHRGVLTTSPLELRDRLASRRPRRAVAASSLARGSAVLASAARRRTPLAPTAHDVPSDGWLRWFCRRTPSVAGCSGGQPPLPLLLATRRRRAPIHARARRAASSAFAVSRPLPVAGQGGAPSPALARAGVWRRPGRRDRRRRERRPSIPPLLADAPPARVQALEGAVALVHWSEAAEHHRRHARARRAPCDAAVSERRRHGRGVGSGRRERSERLDQRRGCAR